METPRRPLHLRDFDAMEADLRELRGRPYARAGTWTLGQVCDHLALFHRQSMEGFAFRMPWYLRWPSPLILRITLRKRWIPEGVKGPPPAMPRPASAIEDTQAVDSLLDMITRYRLHTEPLHPSPLFGQLTRKQWDQIHLIHAAHHLSFIVPKREAPVPATSP